MGNVVLANMILNSWKDVLCSLIDFENERHSVALPSIPRRGWRHRYAGSGQG